MEMKTLIMDEYIIRSRRRICSLCMLCLEMGWYRGTLQTPVNMSVLVYTQPWRGQRPAVLCFSSMRLAHWNILTFNFKQSLRSLSWTVLHRWVLIGICGSPMKYDKGRIDKPFCDWLYVNTTILPLCFSFQSLSFSCFLFSVSIFSLYKMIVQLSHFLKNLFQCLT